MVAPTITQTDPAKIVFFDREVYGLKQRVFDCERISAQVTQEQCAASYLRNNIGSGCHNCSIGRHFSGDAPIAEDRHSAINKSLGLACIRCERNVHTATKYIARFRLTRKHTLCLTCFNREREVVRGYNAKGARPVKHSGLKTAAITVKTAEGERKVEDIGLRSGYLECARYVERVMPGATLLKTEFDGETIGRFSLWTPPFSPWEPGMVRGEKPCKRKRTYTHLGTRRTSKKTSSVASSVDWDDWDTPLYAKPASDDHSDADGNGNARRCRWLPPLAEDDDAAYLASFDSEPAEAAATQVDITEPAEPVEDAVEDSGEPAHDAEPTEWDDLAVAWHDGKVYMLKDLAAERGMGVEALAIELGLIEPEGIEPEPVTPAPAPVAAPALRAAPARKLTGKQLRKLEKAQRRAECIQQRRPGAPKQIAVTARAYIEVLFETGVKH